MIINQSHGTHLDVRRDDFYLLCLDPGYSTGMALLGVREEKVGLLDHQEVPWWPGERTPIHQLQRWLDDTYGQVSVLLYESFAVQSGGFVPDLTPLKVIGAIEYWHAEAHYYGLAEDAVIRPPVVKGSVSSKGTRGVTREHLAKVGMKTSSQHVNDAISHGLGWLAEMGHGTVCRALYGPPEGE